MMELTNSWYLNTSPRLAPRWAFIFRLKARRPVNPFMILSTSADVSARSPGSGAVSSNALRNSFKSTWPLSSSSKAEKAESSSALGESATNASASELRKAARAMV